MRVREGAVTRLVEWMAPRSRADLALKALVFLVLINLANGLSILVRGVPYGLGPDLVNTTVVASPFVVLLLAVLRQQRALQGRLAVMATTDALTGLPNRRAFLGRARLALDGGQGGALLLLDADHFKRINDAHGHAAGDACLRAIAERLRRSLRPGDLAGRLGGEEFALFLPGATRAEVLALGARLCAGVAPPCPDAPVLTLSGGAVLGDGATPLDRLLADADRALYAAKAQGRARVVAWPAEEVVRAA